jgi:hypothetical protein
MVVITSRQTRTRRESLRYVNNGNKYDGIMNELENTTEAAKNTSELANNVYSDLRPIIQPVAKCIGNVLEFASCVTLPLQYWTGVAKANYAKGLRSILRS